MDVRWLGHFIWIIYISLNLAPLLECQGTPSYNYYYYSYTHYYYVYQYDGSYSGIVAGICVGCVICVLVIAVIVAICVKNSCHTNGNRGHVISPGIQSISTSISYTQGYTSTYQGPPAYRSPEPPSSPPPPYSLPNTIYPSHPQYLP